ncbi:arginine--tRNA ligase [Candidatus Micrarchaeota archaeon]|nr:MAG: arginine--tRNA ligase [Candidatus Micrarchaeota archaeon]
MVMYAFDRFVDDVKKAVEAASGMRIEEEHISTPPNPSLGDLSCTIAFEIAKQKKRNPKEVAEEIAGKIKKSGLIKEVKTAGPYINFYLDWEDFAEQVLKEAKDESYGQNDSGNGLKVLLEYSQPNPNKPQHVGHLRNNVLGMAIARILEANGYKVVKANLINNRGIAICKAMLGYLKWGHGATPESSGMKADHFVGKYYIMFTKKAEEDPSLNEEAQKMLQKWEAGDPDVMELWKKIISWAEKGREETYKMLGTEFDVYFYEEEMYERGKEIVMEALRKGVFKKDESGAVIAPLERYGLPDKVVLRADGTSIYITNDIALAYEKLEKFNPDISLYVVAADHKLYFQQLFKILELLDYPIVDKCIHLWYGMVYLPEGKMSSRKGIVVWLDDLVNEVVELARYETAKRNPDADERFIEETARKIALGAIKFAMLKTDMRRDIYFNKEDAIRFEGDTGPYVQYAYARANSILKKLGESKTAGNPALLSSREEKELIMKIAEYPNVVKKAAEYKPQLIAQYLLDLVHTYSMFYESCPVLKAADEKLKASRVALVKAFINVVKNALSLLGIEAPDRM